jgi:hypothetical protein
MSHSRQDAGILAPMNQASAKPTQRTIESGGNFVILRSETTKQSMRPHELFRYIRNNDGFDSSVSEITDR